jgi:hypothetical protein
MPDKEGGVDDGRCDDPPVPAPGDGAPPELELDPLERGLKPFLERPDPPPEPDLEPESPEPDPGGVDPPRPAQRAWPACALESWSSLASSSNR